MKINNYYNLERSKQCVVDGNHRTCIGGMWDELGQLQLDFLVKKGLVPEDRLIDIGCGCLRAGVPLVRYLNKGHYFGTDISSDLIRAGYDIEISKEGLADKLPRRNLLENDDFEFVSFDTFFDVALAQSLFTHLPVNHLRLCLVNLLRVMKRGAVFYATFFLCPTSDWHISFTHSIGGVTTYPTQDPYHYTLSDIECAISGLPWDLELIGDWDHPRGQQMLVFHYI